jgi:NAD(P)-dependent dehydrogenase (short-subunit alcohol dehydrogenase family)
LTRLGVTATLGLLLLSQAWRSAAAAHLWPGDLRGPGLLLAAGRPQRASTADLQTVRKALEVNLLGAWQTSLTLLPLLRASHQGRIVKVSSEAGSLASMTGGTPAYNVSKAALNALTRMLASDLRRDRILVNAVCPGWVATDMGGPGGRPVAEGAASVLWAVDLPHDGPTGGFYRDGHPVSW